jgi:hypothetical protein
MLLEWDYEKMDKEACIFSEDNRKNAKLCDSEQLLVSLKNIVVKEYRHAVERQQGSITIDINMTMLDALPSPEQARETLTALAKLEQEIGGDINFTELMFALLPEEQEYFKGPGLYNVNASIKFANNEHGYIAHKLSVMKLMEVSELFPELDRVTENILLNIPQKERKQLLMAEMEETEFKPTEVQHGMLFKLELLGENRTKTTYLPIVPIALEMRTEPDTKIYYAILSDRQEFFTKEDYGLSPTGHLLEWIGEEGSATDYLQKSRADSMCQGWVDPKDIWVLTTPENEQKLQAVVFMPEQSYLAFPCASRRVQINAWMFNGFSYAQRRVTVEAIRWFGSQNVIWAPKMTEMRPFIPGVLNRLLREGFVCIVPKRNSMAFYWNKSALLAQVVPIEPTPPDAFILRVPLDTQGRVMEHKGLRIDAYGISHHGAYLFKASMPQKLSLEKEPNAIKLRIIPALVRSAVLRYFSQEEPDDFVIVCGEKPEDKEGYQGTFDAGVPLKNATEEVEAKLNQPIMCDLRVRGSVTQSLNKIFEFKVYRFKLLRHERTLLAYIAFKPRTSSLFSTISQYSEGFIRSKYGIKEVRELLWALLKRRKGNGSVYESMKCTQPCEAKNMCEVAYCNVLTGTCESVSLEGAICNKGKGICKNSMCEEITGEEQAGCEHVTCFSSECVKRFPTYPDCRCEERKLSGNECAAGSGICVDGACIPKSKVFPFEVELEAGYESAQNPDAGSELMRVKKGNPQVVDATSIVGQAKYRFNIPEQEIMLVHPLSIRVSVEISEPSTELMDKFGTNMFNVKCYPYEASEDRKRRTTVRENTIDIVKNAAYTCDVLPAYFTTIGASKSMRVLGKDVRLDEHARKIHVKLLLSFKPLLFEDTYLTPPKNRECENVDCSTEVKPCWIGKCYKGRCYYGPAEIGKPCGKGMYCNEEGQCVKEGQKKTPIGKDMFHIVYVPVGWPTGSPQQLFSRFAEASIEHFLTMAELQDCRENIRTYILDIDKVVEKCGGLEVKNVCMPEMERYWLSANTEECAIRLTGIPFNAPMRVVGITLHNLADWRCMKIGGYSITGSHVAIAAITEREETTAVAVSHELGHTFNFCEQYSRSLYRKSKIVHGCKNYYPGYVVGEPGTGFLEELIGKLFWPYKKCEYNKGTYVTNCPEVNMGIVDCYGRKIPHEGQMGRDVMGPAGGGRPRPFDCFELDVLKAAFRSLCEH